MLAIRIFSSSIAPGAVKDKCESSFDRTRCEGFNDAILEEHEYYNHGDDGQDNRGKQRTVVSLEHAQEIPYDDLDCLLALIRD